jgi:hypothetical protein
MDQITSIKDQVGVETQGPSFPGWSRFLSRLLRRIETGSHWSANFSNAVGQGCDLRECEICVYPPVIMAIEHPLFVDDFPNNIRCP